MVERTRTLYSPSHMSKDVVVHLCGNEKMKLPRLDCSAKSPHLGEYCSVSKLEIQVL